MIVDADNFVKKLNMFGQTYISEELKTSKNFSKEIIESIVEEGSTNFLLINEKLECELQNYDLMAVYKSISWFRRVFNSKITSSDINKFFLNKKNNLVNIKTDLILLSKKIEKTNLLLDEELEINKAQLTSIVVNLAKLSRDGKELKDLVLDITKVEENIALELGLKKIELLENLNDDIDTLTVAKTIINQNITFINVTKKNLKQLSKSINLLVEITIPKWDELFAQELTRTKIINV